MRPLDATQSDDTRLPRLRDVLSDEAVDAPVPSGTREMTGGRGRTADLDDAVTTTEALRKRVSRVRELEDRNLSWSPPACAAVASTRRQRPPTASMATRRWRTGASSTSRSTEDREKHVRHAGRHTPRRRS